MSHAEADGATLRGTECLVLGAGGFLGAHLCAALLARGAAVRGYGRRQSYPDALRGVRWLSGDFADRVALARAVEGCDLVFHLLAGSTPESSNKDPAGDLSSGVAPTLQLLDICREAGVRKLLFTSSGGTVYGIPDRVPIDEAAPTDPISAYGIGKLAIEKYLALYRRLHGLDYAILRIANAFGPYQDPNRRQGVIPAMANALLSRRPVEIWGDGQVVRDYLFAPDVCEAILAACRTTVSSRIFNVGSGTGRSLLAVLDDLGTVLGVASPPRVHRAARVADVDTNILDIRLIERELGWTPRTDWFAALRETVAWLSDGGSPGDVTR